MLPIEAEVIRVEVLHDPVQNDAQGLLLPPYQKVDKVSRVGAGALLVLAVVGVVPRVEDQGAEDGFAVQRAERQVNVSGAD
jgi:hypothetical protein